MLSKSSDLQAQACVVERHIDEMFRKKVHARAYRYGNRLLSNVREVLILANANVVIIPIMTEHAM